MHMVRSKKVNIFTILGVLAVCLGAVALAIWGKPLWDTLGNPDRVEALVKDAGPWGPFLYIVMQVIQVFVAPIPGQVIGFVGGYLFGTWLGTLYSMIGATIGFTLVFILSRRLGRPFVEHFVEAKLLKKFDYILENQGVFVLFLIFLLPAFPDDIICFIAGLTRIPIRTLIIISLLGRFPGYLVLSFTGSGVANANIQAVVVVGSVALVISAVAFWQRERLQRFVKRLAKKHPKDGAGTKR